MKLIIVSDLHYSLPQFDWLVGIAEKFDLVLIAGDLLDIANRLDPDAQIVVVSKYLERLCEKTRVAVCSGNHDGDEKNAHGEFIATWLQDIKCDRIFVDGQSFEQDGCVISVCPWWDGDATRMEVEEQLRSKGRDNPGQWFWVHHCPPDQLPVSWTGKKYAGDSFLLQLMHELKPCYIISGHIHNAPFYAPEGSWVASSKGTWSFNPGRQIGNVPAFITLDTETNRAVFLNLEGEQVEDLKVTPAA